MFQLKVRPALYLYSRKRNVRWQFSDSNTTQRCAPNVHIQILQKECFTAAEPADPNAGKRIMILTATIGVVILGMMASFVIARYPFKGREAMYSLFAAVGLLGQMVFLVKDP